MTVPGGASSGTLSHAAANDRAARIVRRAENEPARQRPRGRVCVSISGAKDNTLMYLAGQEGQRGYAMAALLIMISLLSIGMLALLPVWRQQSQREKEAELAFRGEQYARAIYLFRTKNGNQPPPNIDVLVQGRFLRKKYKDPITGEDFQPIFGGQQPQPGRTGPRRRRRCRAVGAPGRGAEPGPGGPSQGRSSGAGSPAQTVTGAALGRERRSDADRRRQRLERRGAGRRRFAGRHRAGDGPEQEQRNVDPHLQQRFALQRVAVPL